MSAPIVILGAGLAGHSVARELRKLDKGVRITMVAADSGAYYSKPSLSNAFRAGKTADGLVIGSAVDMSRQLDIEILADTTVDAIEVSNRRLYMNGKPIEYSQLVLALGADPIKLPLIGNAIAAPSNVNDLASYALLREKLADAHDVTIIGAGLVGCEFANDLADAGYRVTVIDSMTQALGRMCPPECAIALQEALSLLGVRWCLGRQVKGMSADGVRAVIDLDTGESIHCDVVLSAIGLRPRTSIARQAGLATSHGIVTDSYLGTSAEGVYAIGDCAEMHGRVRAFVMPIMIGARALAQTLAGNKTDVRYPHMPVAVKTPALPLVVLPPEQDADGRWQISGTGADRRALFRDQKDNIRGFIVTGSFASEKASILKSMAAA